jgi:hypothetical protein
MQQQEVGQGLDAGLNPLRALWRMGGYVIEDGAEVANGRKGLCTKNP